jgi:exopolysaccharide biosynthesis polyprenyl glycosylphosphotransferase
VNVQPLIPQQRLRAAARRVPASKHALRLRLYAALVAIDLSCIFLAFGLGALVRFGDLGGNAWHNIAFAAMPIYLGMAANSGAYSVGALRSPTRGAVTAMGALAFTFGALFVISYFLKAEYVSRLSLAIGIVGSFVSIGVARKQFGEFIVKTTGGRFTNVIVIGDGAPIRVPPGATYLDAKSVNLAADTRNPEMLQRLANELRGADRVVISCSRELCRNWAMLLKGCTVQGEILAEEFDSVGAIGVGRLCERTTIVVSTGPLNLPQRILKRVLDLVLTIPALIALAPVLLLAAIAIKLDSPGPVFFRQQRVGRGNELFEIFKFRSMRDDASDPMGHRSTMPDDDRITRVGNFIRKTSIDELPQLLNVLFGSMSIVGPRPHALGSLAEQQLFWEIDERYWHRHALKPGITGLAQIRGHRGATHRRDDLTRRLQADLEYLSGWSIWRDIAIIIATIRVIVHPRAY